MGFASGSVSFRRFAVIKPASGETWGPSEELLDRLRMNALKERDLGVPEELEYGFSGGRHLFDASFSFEHNIFGDFALFAIRIDTNKAPGELKKAYQALEEEALAAENPSGFLSKAQKKDAKDSVKAKLEDELREGRHRRSKLVPVLWDTARHIVYSPATGKSLEILLEIFERSFGSALDPLTSGALALRHMEPLGRRRDYEDLKPTRFVLGPEGEGQAPEYPWVAKGPQPKDFLGNEFLLYAWHHAETHDGNFPLPNQTDLTLMIDRSLDLDCAYAYSGKDALRGDGPTRMPEARDALKSGKLPRKAGLVVDTAGEQFALNFNSEAFAFNSLKLPEIEADTPRELIEARLDHLTTICQAFEELYSSFLKLRCSASWEGHANTIRKWIASFASPTRKVEVELHRHNLPQRLPDREPIEG